jgi:GAF domain-containing protein
MSWEPADYIRDGKYCDLDTLRGLLEEMRLAARAEAAALLTHRASRESRNDPADRVKLSDFLRSVFLVTPTSSPLAQNIDLTPFTNAKATLSLPANGSEGLVRALFSTAAHLSPFRHWHDLLGPSGKVHVFRASLGVPARGLPRMASVLVLLMEPRTALDKQTLDKHLQTILTYVNATASVAIRYGRDMHLTADDLAGGISPDEYLESDEDWDDNWLRRYMERIANEVVRRAVTLTRSQDGAIYLLDPTKRKLLRLAAFAERSQGAGEYPPELTFTDARRQNEIIADVCDETDYFPRLFTTPEDFRAIYPDMFSSQTAPLLAQVAVPIVQQHFESSYHSVFGALTVRKSPDTAPTYTHQHFLILQHLAERFCNWRGRIMSALGRRSMSLLVREPPQSAPPSLHDVPSGIDPEMAAHVPVEAWVAQDRISRVFNDALSLTGSFGGSVRLLSPNTQRLTLFCYSPRPTPNIIPFSLVLAKAEAEHQLGSLKQVIDTGLPLVVPNVDDEKYRVLVAQCGMGHLKKVSPDVKSLIIVPIFVGRRIAGTLFLGSNFHDAYSETIHLLRTLAGQIGVALAMARREDEYRVLQLTARARGHAHALEHNQGPIDQGLDKVLGHLASIESLVQHPQQVARPAATCASPDSFASSQALGTSLPSLDLHHTINQLRDNIADISRRWGSVTRAPLWDTREGGTAALTTILTDVTEQYRLLSRDKDAEVFRWSSTNPKEYLVRAGPAARIRSAWLELVLNATEFDDLPIRLQDTSVVLGGHEYLRLSFENYNRKPRYPWPLPPALALQIFRVPHEVPESLIPDKKEIKIGSYLAGALLRSIDGDVFLVDNTPSRVSFAVDLYQRQKGGTHANH